MQVPILKQGPYLIATVQSALTDADLVGLRDAIVERVGRHRARGVIIDVTSLDVMDSFATGTLRDVAHMTRLRGARTVIVGIQPDVAYAHGLPADIYSMNLDGSNLTRIADIKDDDPTVAWSPDGSKLGIFGVAALFVVDAKGGPTDKLVDQGGYGGLDWTR